MLLPKEYSDICESFWRKSSKYVEDNNLETNEIINCYAKRNGFSVDVSDCFYYLDVFREMFINKKLIKVIEELLTANNIDSVIIAIIMMKKLKIRKK